MNFFEHQERARKQTRRLIVLFSLAVIAIVVVANVAILIALGIAAPSTLADGAGIAEAVRQRPMVFAVVSLAVVGVVVLASLTRMAGLRGGGSAVARQLGGVPLPDEGGDFHQRRLRNVVEEIAIASGLPVPEIYVLEQEPAINAFAAGYSGSDAVVAVTRGALDRLNRDELQGVIAHEFSHILNGDMRLNIRLVGVLFGILMLNLIGRRVLLHMPRGRNSRGSAPILIIALLLIVVGWVGVFFGRLIKAGVSRQREFLADASAVQFTRQTAGIAGALKKIGGIGEGSRLTSSEGEEISHMLFGDGFGLSGLLATHPPLLQRIRALEPQFRAEQLTSLRAQWRQAPPSGRDEDIALGFAEPQAGLPAESERVTVHAGQVAGHVGNPDEADYRLAHDVLANLPAELAEAAHQRDQATALVLGLLISGRPEVRAAQRKALEGLVAPEWLTSAWQLSERCRGLHPLQRLPLAELAFPRLRRYPRTALMVLEQSMSTLIHADGQIELFEYALSRLLRVQVLESLDPPRHRSSGRIALMRVRDQAHTLLAIVAQQGHGQFDGAQRAFNAGLARVSPGEHHAYQPPSDWIEALDSVLPALDELDSRSKSILLEGLAACVGNDGRLSLNELELLRVICGVLHCPIPPVLFTV